jgi:oligopeptide/dipeptide ABC transporter ATP-binding protein
VPIPDPAAERRRRRVILQGDVPSPVNPPSGCRFHTRCWLYEQLGRPEICRTEDPPVRSIEGDHGAACHYAEDALRSDVGVSHIDEQSPRRGTPDAVLAHRSESRATAAAVAAAHGRSSTAQDAEIAEQRAREAARILAGEVVVTDTGVAPAGPPAGDGVVPVDATSPSAEKPVPGPPRVPTDEASASEEERLWGEGSTKDGA